MSIKNHTISVVIYPKDNKIAAIDVAEGYKSLDAQVTDFLDKLHFSQIRDIIAQSINNLDRMDGFVLARTIVYTTEVVAAGFNPGPPKVAPK